MIRNCPNCKNELLSDHSFCPHCGYDLRTNESTRLDNEIHGENATLDEPINQIERIPVKDNFKTPFIFALSFTAISIFIWSYAYTNWTFDLNAFLKRLINHSFWILLLPYLISLAFKKEKRASVYSNMVLLFIVLGTIFLFIGYWQRQINEDPVIVRHKLKRACIDDVIKQLDDVDVSYELKNMRATKYCDCINEKLNDDDLNLISSGEKKFWDTISKEENKQCVLVSLEND